MKHVQITYLKITIALYIIIFIIIILEPCIIITKLLLVYV